MFITDEAVTKVHPRIQQADMVNSMNQVAASSDDVRITVKVEPTENSDQPPEQTGVNGPQSQTTAENTAENRNSTHPVSIKTEIEDVARPLVRSIITENDDIKPNVSLSEKTLDNDTNNNKEEAAKVSKYAEQSDKSSTTKDVNSCVQLSTATVASSSHKDVLLSPDVDACNPSSSSGCESEMLETVTQASEDKMKVRSQKPPAASLQQNVVQNSEHVGQPEKILTARKNMYSCAACGMSFRFHSTLKIHLERDVKKLSYECKHCAKKMVFYNKCKLTEHIRMHCNDAVLPDMADLASRIPESHPIFCDNTSMEDEDSDSEIEVYDVDCQPRTSCGKSAIKSERIVEESDPVQTVPETTAHIVVKDGGSANTSKLSLNSSVPCAAERPVSGDITTGSSVPAGGDLGPVVSKAETAGSSPDFELNKSVSAIGSLDHFVKRFKSAVVNKFKSTVNNVGPVVSISETSFKSLDPVVSQSQCAVGTSESAVNISDSSVSSLDSASEKSGDVGDKLEPAVITSEPTSDTSYVMSRHTPSVIPLCYAVRPLECTLTNTLVRPTSSLGPIPPSLRPEPVPSVRPVLSVRPFHSVRPANWTTSAAIHASAQKSGSAVANAECVVDRSTVTNDRPAVPVDISAVPNDRPAVSNDRPTVPADKPTVPVDRSAVTVDRPVTVERFAVTVNKPAVTSSEPVYVGLRVKGFALEQSSETIVICNECKKKMPLGELQNHFQTPNLLLSVESLQCPRCDLILPTICSFHAHKRIHFKRMPFVCPECGHVFSTFELLNIHLHTVCFHHQKCASYYCTFCKVICKTAEDLVEHILRSKHFIYAFVCTACTTVHRKYPELQLHMEQRHDPAKQPAKKIYYECLLCPKKLINVPEIQQHAATHPRMYDSLLYSYKCAACNFVAYSKARFAAHRETCIGKVPVHGSVRPSHKIFVKSDGTAIPATTLLIQAVDSKGNVTFQKQVVHKKLANGRSLAFASPVKLVKTSKLIVPNADVKHINTVSVRNAVVTPKSTDTLPQKDVNHKNFNPPHNPRVINFVDANADCEERYSVSEKSDSEITSGDVVAEENETFGTSEENEKDPLSLEGMEPSKTTTSSCVVCGKFVERSLIRSEVQRVPVRCASCVAKSCYESKSKNVSVLVVSPKSISNTNIQVENGPAKKKRRLSSSSTNDKFKCRKCFSPLPSDYSSIQNHYKTMHDEEMELTPDILELKEKIAKEQVSSCTEEDVRLDSDKKNGVEKNVRNGSCTKTKKRKKSSKNAESKGSIPGTPSPSENNDSNVNETISTKDDTNLDNSQKELREGYCCKHGSCQFSTNDISAFKEHIISHRSPEYIYQCMECGYASKSGFSLSYHLMLSHGITDVEDYASKKKECYFGAESESSDYDSDYSWSESQINGDGEDVGDNGCRVCREEFDSSQELEQHIRTHGMAFLVHMKRNRGCLLEKQSKK